MNAMAIQISVIYILLYFLAEVHGGCHTSQSNFAVCHDEKRFTMNVEGISKDLMQTCPDGYVCTDQPEICLKSSDANPTCEAACGQCNLPDKLFACVNANTYAFCFGEDSPNDDARGVCPPGYVCNIGSTQICKPDSDVYPSCYDGLSNAPTTLSPITSAATTESSSDTTPTIPNDTSSPTVTDNPITIVTQSTSTRHPRDESEFCTYKQHGGLYKSENDPTCKEYILCYILSGQYFGIKYTCMDNEYFNEATQRCQAQKPTGC